jgi:hypothetical protein
LLFEPGCRISRVEASVFQWCSLKCLRIPDGFAHVSG